MCEPATPRISEGVLVELEGCEDSPAHNHTAMCEYELASGGYFEELKDIVEDNLIDFFGEIIPYLQSSQYLQKTHPSSLSRLLNQPVPQPHLCHCPSSSRHQQHAIWR